MKNKLPLLLGVILGCVLFAAGLYAGTTVEDVIKMETKGYSTHKKGIVTFSHKKHMEEYAAKAPDLFKNGCGECHHDKDGKPLTSLKAGDDVKGCFECHNKEGEKPKGKDAPKLSKKEAIAYHAEALHTNCKGCHKDFNKANNTTDAPVTCNKCHAKKEK